MVRRCRESGVGAVYAGCASADGKALAVFSPHLRPDRRTAPAIFLGRGVKKTWLDIVALAVLAGVPVATLYIYPAIMPVVLPVCIAAGVAYLSQTRGGR